MNDSKKKKNKNPKQQKMYHPPASNPAVQCLTQLMISNELSDLTIIITGHNGKFKVRIVLAMWSSVFKEMLFGPNPVGNTLTLTPTKPGTGHAHRTEAIECLINYMYTGEAKLNSEILAVQDYYALAHKYIMNHLKTVCSQYLLIHLSAVNAPVMLSMAITSEDSPLTKRCAMLIPESFYTSPSIEEVLTTDSLELLLKEDVPISSEVVIFKGILNWGKLHLKSQKK
ncbi:unnamed protein product, partial [Meganyctiphanes norvegica]